jgi:hypothetical protein
MKKQHWLLVTLLCFFLGILSPAAPAKDTQNPAYEDVWWAQNPTLSEFIQNKTHQLKTIAVVAATNFISLNPEVQNNHSSWRIENPTLNESESSTILTPFTTPDSQDGGSQQRTRSSGFRTYGENPTI